jgi:hypothetical protein
MRTPLGSPQSAREFLKAQSGWTDAFNEWAEEEANPAIKVIHITTHTRMCTFTTAAVGYVSVVTVWYTEH